MRIISIVAGVLLAVAPLNWAQAQTDQSVTIVLPVEPSTLDPCSVSVSSVGIVARQNIIETLTVLNTETGELTPRLAIEWQRLDDLTWRFKLRQGVKFHDGSDFKADSVAFTLDRLQNKALTCPDRGKSSLFDMTTSIIDDYTIDVKTSTPQGLLPLYLASIGISIKGLDQTNLIREPVGTGPYVFKGWDANGISVERFADYWGDQPDIAKATYVVRNESAVRAAMVKLGEADIAVGIAPQDATEPDLDFSFLNTETTRIFLVMAPPLDDIRVRKALNLAIDRQSLIGTVLDASVLPAVREIIPSVLGDDPELKPWPFDPNEARRLVDEARAAGAPVDQEIRLIGRIGHYPNVDEVLQTLVQMWNDAGLNVKLEMMESGQWLQVANTSWQVKRPAMMISSQANTAPGDAGPILDSRYHSRGRQSQTNNPALDAAIDAGDRATGEEQRKLYEQAFRIIERDLIAGVPLFHMVTYMRIGSRLLLKPDSNYNGQLELATIGFKS